MFQGLFHHVPVISGTTRDEGLIFMALYLMNETLFEDLRDNWETAMPMIVFGR